MGHKGEEVYKSSAILYNTAHMIGRETKTFVIDLAYPFPMSLLRVPIYDRLVRAGTTREITPGTPRQSIVHPLWNNPTHDWFLTTREDHQAILEVIPRNALAWIDSSSALDGILSSNMRVLTGKKCFIKPEQIHLFAGRQKMRNGQIEMMLFTIVGSTNKRALHFGGK